MADIMDPDAIEGLDWENFNIHPGVSVNLKTEDHSFEYIEGDMTFDYDGIHTSIPFEIPDKEGALENLSNYHNQARAIRQVRNNQEIVQSLQEEVVRLIRAREDEEPRSKDLNNWKKIEQMYWREFADHSNVSVQVMEEKYYIGRVDIYLRLIYDDGDIYGASDYTIVKTYNGEGAATNFARRKEAAHRLKNEEDVVKKLQNLIVKELKEKEQRQMKEKEKTLHIPLENILMDHLTVQDVLGEETLEKFTQLTFEYAEDDILSGEWAEAWDTPEGNAFKEMPKFERVLYAKREALEKTEEALDSPLSTLEQDYTGLYEDFIENSKQLYDYKEMTLVLKKKGDSVSSYITSKEK